MPNFFASALLFHWTVVFAALALVCTIEPEAGMRAPLHLLGLDASALDPGFAARASALFGAGFLLSASLYAWATLSAVLGETSATDVTRLAFGVSVLVLTVLFAACAMQGVGGLTVTFAALLAATLASYLVIGAEHPRPVGQAEAEPANAAARMMAADAAHTSLLSGQPGSGRSNHPEGRN